MMWDRLTDIQSGQVEPDAAFAAFRVYRDSLPSSRCVYAAALHIHRQNCPRDDEPPPSLVKQLERWSSKWDWLSRAGAWDDEQDRLRREDRSARLKAIVARQLQDTVLASQLLLRPIAGIVEATQRDRQLKCMSDRDLTRSVLRAVRALAESQAAERAMWESRPNTRPSGPELVEMDNMTWTSPKTAAHKLNEDAVRGESETPTQKDPGEDESDSGVPHANQHEEEGQLSLVDPWWARQTNAETGKREPLRAFHWFSVFRDLPAAKRSLAAVTKLMREEKGRAEPEAASAGAPKRRRERVSSTVEEWSATWKWQRRASAWDDEQDRVQRRAAQEEIRKMRDRHSQQLEAVANASRGLMIAMAERVRDRTYCAGEDAEMVRCGSESIPLMARLHAAEIALRGDAEEVPERMKIRIDGFQFCWSEVNCLCGHPHSQHDQLHADPSLVPCTIEGCECQKFRRPIIHKEDIVSDSEQGKWRLREHLRYD